MKILSQNDALSQIADIIKQTNIITPLGVNQKLDPIFDKDGVSLKMTKYGGWRLRAVDLLVESWKKSSNPNKRFVAEDQDEFYCFERPDIKLTDDVQRLVEQNQAFIWFSSATQGNNVDDLYIMRGRYENIKTGEEIDTIPNLQQRESGNWKRIRNRQEEVIENHAVVANGNSTNPLSNKWKTNLFDRIAEFVENRMNAHLKKIESSQTRR